MKQRSIEIDCLKAFAIFLVCWGHCIQYFSNVPFVEQPLYRLIYSFHMPLFMALVGYFSAQLLKSGSFVDSIKKRFIQLVLPAVSFTMLFTLLNVDVFVSFRDLLKKIVFDFWFLKSAFICSVLFLTFCYVDCLRLPGLIISVILSQFTDYFMLNIMYPSFVFGYVMRTYHTLIIANRKPICITSGAIFLCMLLFWDKEFWHKPLLTFDINDINFIEHWYKTIYKIIIGCTGTLFLFTCACVVKPADNQFVRKWGGVGQLTLGIYLLQTLFIERLLDRWITLNNPNPIIYNLIFTPIMSVVSLTLCVLIINQIKRSALASFFLLGKQPERLNINMENVTK